MLSAKIICTSLLALGVSAAAVVLPQQLSPQALPTTTSGELSPTSASLSLALLGSTQIAAAPVVPQSTGIIASGSTSLATVNSTTWANFTTNGKSVIDMVSGSGWATFYNDHRCTAKGGKAVSVSNPGCLGERGRNSIYFQPGESDRMAFNYSLILTSGLGCHCQVQCIESIVYRETSNFCYDLNGHADAESFRFIQGRCGKNNC